MTKNRTVTGHFYLLKIFLIRPLKMPDSEIHVDLYICAACDKSFHSESLLFKHNCLTYQIDMFECLICSKTFDDSSSLSDHVGLHEICKIYQCGICGCGFHENSLLLQHLKNCDKTQRSFYKCTNCSLEFSEVVLLDQHVINEHSPHSKKYRCGLCYKEFSSKTKFISHTTLHQSKSQQKKLKCTVNSFKQNLDVVGSEKDEVSQLECDISLKCKEECVEEISCENQDNQSIVFEDEIDLDKSALNSTDRPLTCASDAEKQKPAKQLFSSNEFYSVDCIECKRSFESLNLLKEHLQDSDCLGNFCSECSISFELESMLLVHKARMHLKSEDGHQCSKCSKSFSTKLKFSRHAGTHAQSKPFLCRVCNNRYAHADHIFFHLKTVHGIEKEKCGRKRELCKRELSENQAGAASSAYHQFVKSPSEVENKKRSMSDTATKKINDITDKKSYFYDCSFCGERIIGVKSCFVKHYLEHFFGSKFIIHCHDCKETFSKVSSINEHIKSTKCPGFQCKNCKHSFGLQTELLIHEAKEHCTKSKIDDTYNCHTCFKSFKTRKDFVRHATTHADIKSFQCKPCRTWYPTMEYIRRHIRISHSKEVEKFDCKFDCQKCDGMFMSQEALNKHVTVHNSEDENERFQGKSFYNCNKCPKIFWLHSALAQHKKSHLKSLTKKRKTFACSICKKLFSENHELQRHRGIHTRPYLCSVCGKSFATTRSLKEHCGVHSRPYFCSVCEKSFSLSRSLKEHMKVYHSKENPFKCKHCEKKYFTRKSFRLHMRTHTGENTLKCEHCEKVFVDPSSLRSHLKSHNPDKPFKCSYSSKQKSGLSRHLLSHKLIKNHLCPICNKAFTQRSHVVTHMKLHSKVKDHICDACGKAFARSDALKNHMRTHTKEKPYTCPVCGRSFCVPKSMVSHITKMHPDYKYQYKRLRVNYKKDNVIKSENETESSREASQTPSDLESSSHTDARSQHLSSDEPLSLKTEKE